MRDERAAARGAVASLRAIAASEAAPAPTLHDVAGDEPWLRYALQIFEGDRQRDGLDAQLRSIAPTPAEGDAVTEALDVLAAGWPAMADAVNALVRTVIWCRSESGAGLRSGSLPQAFGAVFVSTVTPPPTVTAALEALVHETTHLDLMMRTALDKLVINGDALGRSPFRRRERPLNRVLHAASVASRVSTALDRCLPYLPPAERDLAVERHQGSDDELAEAVETLVTHGEFTPAGTALVAQLGEHHRSCAK